MSKTKQPDLFGEQTGSRSRARRTASGVVVREVTCKNLLNRSRIDDYSFNCYTGCAHGCVYCYARFMQRFHPHKEPWGKFVDVKINAAESLQRQLRRLPPGEVFTCSACDGWQPIEKKYKLTRRCCELLLEEGFSLKILTKSELVLRDLDILTGGDVCVGVTITTADEKQRRLWEPKASSVESRLRVLREAKAAGLKTAVMFGPLLPEISDTPDALRELFALAAEARVDRIWTDVLNPRPRVWPSIQQYLRRRSPRLLEHYRRVLFDRDFRARYVKQLNTRIRRAAANAKVTNRMR